MRKFVILSEIIRERAIEYLRALPLGSMLQIREGEGRSLDQNALLWPLLEDVSEQVLYHGNKLSPDDWKDVFSASLAGELRMAPTLDGQRIVLLGLRTSKMTKKKFSQLIELIYAYGTEKGVEWSEVEHVEREHEAAQNYLRKAA